MEAEIVGGRAQFSAEVELLPAQVAGVLPLLCWDGSVGRGPPYDEMEGAPANATVDHDENGDKDLELGSHYKRRTTRLFWGNPRIWKTQGFRSCNEAASHVNET